MRYLSRLSLRAALGLFVVLPLVVALGVAAFMAIQVFERQAEDRMEEDVELVARSIQGPLARGLVRDEDQAVEEALRSAFAIDRVYGAHLYDLEAGLVASVGEFGGSGLEEVREVATSGSSRGIYREADGDEIYSFLLPIPGDGGEPVGLLEVTRRAEDVSGYAEMLRWEAGLFLLLAALAMGAVIVWGHQTVIGRPLAALTRAMERVEEGDRTHRADVFGPREIVELGTELNRMLDSIAEAESEIEQRRRAQISLERQLQQAEKLAAIGQLSAGIAHEIGSPLSVIEGKAQRALRRDDLSPRERDTLQSIRRQVRRVEHVIHQLLEFGRHHEVDPRAVPAERLIHRCVNALREKREERGIAIDVDGSSPAPDLWVDPALVERALTNLLRNALDASREGRVRLSWVETDDEIGIRVEDDGPGVDAEAKSRIFEPFFTTKKIGEGTGLGLAVARAIVEEHDGRIEVGDADLGGASFTLYFEPAEKSVSV